jgi:hypothetical protein
MILTGETEVMGEKPLSMPHCPRQSHVGWPGIEPGPHLFRTFKYKNHAVSVSAAQQLICCSSECVVWITAPSRCRKKQICLWGKCSDVE